MPFALCWNPESTVAAICWGTNRPQVGHIGYDLIADGCAGALFLR